MNLILLLFIGVFLCICFFVHGAKKYIALSLYSGLLFFTIFLLDGGTRFEEIETETLGKPRVLRFLVPEGMIPDAIYEQLEKDTGIAVEKTTYSNNQEFEGIIESGKAFDVAFPTDFMALRMKRLGYALDIDYKRIPNAKMISAHMSGHAYFKPLFDCSVPYLFGTLSIGYNRFYFDNLPLSWKTFFDDVILNKMKGYVALNDEMRNMLGIILKAKGYSPNSINPDEVREAGKYLISIMDASLPYMTTYGNDELLVDETVYIGVVWSSEMNQAMEKNPKMRFANADEGSVVLMECFSIMKKCQDKATAYEFINYMYKPKVSAKVTNLTYRANLNDGAKPYIRPEILNGPSYFFPEHDEVIIREDLIEGEEIYREVWAEVISHYEKVIVPKRDEELVLDF